MDNDKQLSAKAEPAPAPGTIRRKLRFRWTGFDRVLLLLLFTFPLLVFALRSQADVIGFAEANVISLVSCVVLFLTLLFRIIFSHHFSRTARGILLAITVLAITCSAVAVRIDRVSGRLVPVLRWSWSKKPDQLLAQPEISADATIADLTITSDRDFPQFLGPHRNLQVSQVELATDWQINPPRELWRQPIGAGWSGFSVVNGFAVTMEQRGEDELVTCYEISTGKMCWSHGFATRHETVLGGTGPRCTPTIDEGRVFAQGATGIVRCLNGSTGELIWSDHILQHYDVTPDQDLKAVAWGRSASPLVVDDLLVVPFGGPAGGPYDSLVAYDKQTGKIRWKGGDRQVSYSSPTLAVLGGVRQIVIVNEDSVAGHRPEDGEVLWSHPWRGQSNAGASVSQPVVLPADHLLLSKAYGQGARLLQISVESPNAWKAATLWANRRLLKTKFTNVAVIGEYVYGLSDGILECVNWRTGDQRWKDRRKGNFGHGQLLAVGDVLFVQSEAGDLVLIEPHPDELREVARFSALSEQCWNNPCLFGRYLLVRNSVEAACFELPLRRSP